MSKKQIFAGHLVHLAVKDLIPPDIAGKSKLTLEDLKQIARGRVADGMAKFIIKHFTTEKVQEDGSVLVEAKLTALLSEVPPGLAHTTIIFQEAPKV